MTLIEAAEEFANSLRHADATSVKEIAEFCEVRHRRDFLDLVVIAATAALLASERDAPETVMANVVAASLLMGARLAREGLL